MGIRRTLYRLLSRGGNEVDDDDEYVELGVLSRIEGPIVIAKLLDHGIEAVAHETFDVAVGRPGGLRITGPRGSLAEAVRLWGGRA
jgi:hypothetical protein